MLCGADDLGREFNNNQKNTQAKNELLKRLIVLEMNERFIKFARVGAQNNKGNHISVIKGIEEKRGS